MRGECLRAIYVYRYQWSDQNEMFLNKQRSKVTLYVYEFLSRDALSFKLEWNYTSVENW